MTDQKEGFGTHVLRILKRFFITMGVAATIVFVLLTSTLEKAVHYVPQSLPDKFILAYTFRPGLVEMVTKPSLSQPLLRPATTFHEVIDSLTQASKDDRVKGLVAKIESVDMTPAQLQELRDTLLKFRKAGKFADVFAEDFGGAGSGMGDYYLASAFDQIWLQPVGSVSVMGVAAEVPFFKGIFDKVGVDAEFLHKGKYKSFPESLTATEMSAEQREMMTDLVNDISSQLTDGIAADRKMTAEQVRQLINGAPYSDSEAQKLGLVDHLGYYDEMLAQAKQKAGIPETDVVGLLYYSFNTSTINLHQGMTGFVSRFAHKANPEYVDRDKDKIALIYGVGDLVPYRSRAHAAFGEGGMSADRIVDALEDAQKDKDIAAVVLRIDSPGGQPEAAEAIHRAILETQKKGKPVIVSMGGYAASGGYWIATPADKIVAQPATITGSIGVFGGKFVLSQLWDKLGVKWDSVQAGDNARMWSINSAFTDAEKARFDALLDNTYQAFIARVMEGRKLTRDQVLAVAEGRVWTGRQAKDRGLVDELGGLDKAIEVAKVAAKLKPEQDVPVEILPRRKSTLEMFIDLATEGSTSVAPLVHISAKDIVEALKEASASEESSRFILH